MLSGADYVTTPGRSNSNRDMNKLKRLQLKFLPLRKRDNLKLISMFKCV